MLLTGLEALAKFLAPRLAAGAWTKLRAWWRSRGAVAHATRVGSAAFAGHAVLLRGRACKTALRVECEALAHPGEGGNRRRLAQALRTASPRGLDPEEADALAGRLLSELGERLRNWPPPSGRSAPAPPGRGSSAPAPA